MPRQLPEDVLNAIKGRMPATHRLLWVRGEFLSSEPVERPPFLSDLLTMPINPGRPIMDTRVAIGDLDSPAGEGYDLRIQDGLDIAPEDTISLLGHEPVGANRLTKPRLLYNHNTNRYYRAYPDLGNGAYLTMLDYKYILACRAPATLENRLRDVGRKLDLWFLSEYTPSKRRIRNLICAAVLLLFGFKYLGLLVAVQRDPYLLPQVILPLLLLVMLFGTAALLAGVAACFYIGIRLRRALAEPPPFRLQDHYTFAELMGYDNITNYLKYTYSDITYLYEDVCKRLNEWVEANPDPETPFVVGQKRQSKEKGKVIDTPLNRICPVPALGSPQSAGNPLSLPE